MTGFINILFFIVSFYAAVNFFRMFMESRRIFHFYLGSSAIFLSIIGLSPFLAEFFTILDPEFINDWSSIFAVAFVLSAAAAQIRDSKPAFTRFPRALTVLPLLLILFYPLIMNTIVLKLWILLLYEGSAITIGLLIYGYKTYREPVFSFMFIGVLFFLATYVMYWLPSNILELPGYAWVLLMTCGMLIITVGYNKVYQYEPEERIGNRTGKEWFI